MTPFETIAAIIDAAGPAERPQEVAVPARASAPKDKTGGRRKAAAPPDPSSEAGQKKIDTAAAAAAAPAPAAPPNLRIVAGTDAQHGAREGESAQNSPLEACADGMAGQNPAEAPARPAKGDGDMFGPRSNGFNVDELNKQFAYVLLGNKAVIFNEEKESLVEDHQRMLDRAGFIGWFENRFTEYEAPDGSVKKKDWGTVWLKHPRRRQYRGVEFHPDPNNVPGMKGYLNLWSGFAVTPAPKGEPGTYKIFRDHLLGNVCGGDERLLAWVFAFFAHIVQRPRERIGVALVMRGKMGSGKTKVGEVIGSLFPRHYFLVDDPRYVTGQFNAHMATCLLLQADEAVWAGDKSAEGRLKGLITSPIQQIERKGIDAIRLPNYVRLIMTSNEDWVVPAGKDERRFCVLDVDPRCAQNHDYFREMDEELAAGGREQLLADLLAFDLASVNLRKIPHTAALLEQKLRSLDSVDMWWFERLMAGTTTRRASEWNTEIPCQTLFDDYIGTSDRIGVRRKQDETVVGMRLTKIMPEIRRVRRERQVTDRHEDGSLSTITRRVWCYELPPLDRAREQFENLLGQAVAWLDVTDTKEREPDVVF